VSIIATYDTHTGLNNNQHNQWHSHPTEEGLGSTYITLMTNIHRQGTSLNSIFVQHLYHLIHHRFFKLIWNMRWMAYPVS